MYLEHRGFRMYYDDLGQGTPLLCLPAFPFDHAMYRSQLVLQDACRLILPDYRGTGQSGLAEGPATMEVLAQDMLALLDHLHLDRAVVLGVSMGVYVGFSMYSLHPERFAGFILANSRPEADTTQAAARRQTTVEGLRQQGASFLRPRVEALFGESTRKERPQLVAEMQESAGRQPAEGLARITLGLAGRFDRRALLPGIQTPCMVVCGREDTVSPAETMFSMARTLPEAEFHLIPRAGHLAVLEQPEAFNRLCRGFLARL